MGWVYFVGAILFGIFLYWFRCRCLICYGVVEILVALLLIYIFFFPEGENLLAGAVGSDRLGRCGVRFCRER